MDIIQSAHNPLIRTLHQINNNHFRQKHKQTLLEGIHLVESWAMHKPNNIQCLVLSSDGLKNVEFNKYFNQFKIHVIDKKLWQDITSLPSYDILAIINYKLEEFRPSTCGIILDNIQDSGNMGNIIRTASACEYNFVLAIGGASVYSPKVLRSAMGGHLFLNIYQIQDLNHIQNILINTKTNIFLTSIEANDSLYDINIPKNHIWVIGNEGNGIHKSWFNLKTTKVYIPQNKDLESLNASSAASICLYEKVRRKI